jgi:hypothetical protein
VVVVPLRGLAILASAGLGGQRDPWTPPAGAALGDRWWHRQRVCPDGHPAHRRAGRRDADRRPDRLGGEWDVPTHLIRLVVPKVSPAGVLTALTGEAIYRRARGWRREMLAICGKVMLRRVDASWKAIENFLMGNACHHLAAESLR